METNECHYNLLSKVVVCRECGEPFVLSAGERKFYIDRKLKEPLRCSECRWRRRSGEDGERR
jgi:DNA-directed RNA polymerase subunit RPC12/RpoP